MARGLGNRASPRWRLSTPALTRPEFGNGLCFALKKQDCFLRAVFLAQKICAVAFAMARIRGNNAATTAKWPVHAAY